MSRFEIHHTTKPLPMRAVVLLLLLASAALARSSGSQEFFAWDWQLLHDREACDRIQLAPSQWRIHDVMSDIENNACWTYTDRQEDIEHRNILLDMADYLGYDVEARLRLWMESSITDSNARKSRRILMALHNELHHCPNLFDDWKWKAVEWKAFHLRELADESRANATRFIERTRNRIVTDMFFSSLVAKLKMAEVTEKLEQWKRDNPPPSPEQLAADLAKFQAEIDATFRRNREELEASINETRATLARLKEATERGMAPKRRLLAP